MAYLIPIVIFGLAYNKKSKIVTIVILAYMWMLVGLNTYTPDYAEYEKVYYNPFLWDVEYGYRFLCVFFRGFGFDYQQFRMFFAAIYVLLLYCGIRRNTEYVNLVLALYLLWPFVPFVSGARYSLAVAIFFNGIPYLYEEKKYSTLKYILVVGVACLFHIGAIVFLGYLLTRKKYGSKLYLIAFLLITALSIVIKAGILESIAYALGIWKLIKWISMSVSEVGRLNAIGFLCYVVVLLANLFISALVGKRALDSAERVSITNLNEMSISKKHKYNAMLNINLGSLLIIPFYLISSEYTRYLFTTLMVNYCLFAGYKNEYYTKKYMNKRVYMMLFIIIIAMTGLFYMYSQRSHDVMATLVDNMFFHGKNN